MSQTSDVTQNRQRLNKLLQLQGYSACREALVLLVDHYTSSTKYDSIEDFIYKLNRTITFETNAGTSIIDPDLAYLVIKKLCNAGNNKQPLPATADGDANCDTDPQSGTGDGSSAPVIQLDQDDDDAELTGQANLVIKVKNVEYQQVSEMHSNGQLNKRLLLNNKHTHSDLIESAAAAANAALTDSGRTNEFNIHYNFLYKRLNSLPIFRESFKLMSLDQLTASSQPSIRCICFGLLIKDISKIDGYMLIDSTGRVPVRITPDTTFRNRMAYTNCIVLVEGVYVNPDDVLFAANVGLPPILLDPIADKQLACRDEKMIVILRELFMDDDDVCRYTDMLFTGYNSMDDPPILFILIGDFTRNLYPPSEYRSHTKKLIRIIRQCDNLKECHFVFVPGQRDSAQLFNGTRHEYLAMPKPPLTKDQMPVNLLQLSNFNNIHLATNPAHIYLGERQISVVSHSYLKELSKYLLHDLSDHREELFETAKQILLSNAHLSAGISKSYHSSMNLWHKPDLLILADTEAVGNKYNYSSSKADDTTFTTAYSFSLQFSQFKVYYLKSGEVEDSQVSQDALEQIVELDSDDDNGDAVQVLEEDQERTGSD